MMEVDTGAAVTIVSEEQFRRLQPRGQVSSSAVVLRTYTSRGVSRIFITGFPTSGVGDISTEVVKLQVIHN